MTAHERALDTILGMIAMLLRSIAQTSPDVTTRTAAREVLMDIRAKRQSLQPGGQPK